MSKASRPSKAAPDAKRINTNPENHGKTILIVDDDRIQIAKNKALFEHAGFQTLQARTPREARDGFIFHHIDLLFTDLIMPGTDGIELYSQLSEQHPECIAILQTAYLNPMVRKEAQANHFAACLPKSASSQEVLVSIHSALNSNIASLN